MTPSGANLVSFAIVIFAVLLAFGIRVAGVYAGTGGVAATIAGGIVGMLFAAALFLIRARYLIVGISILVMMSLLFVAAALYVNAYRTM